MKYLSHVCDIQGGQLLILDSHLIEQESQWVQRRLRDACRNLYKALETKVSKQRSPKLVEQE